MDPPPILSNLYLRNILNYIHLILPRVLQAPSGAICYHSSHQPVYLRLVTATGTVEKLSPLQVTRPTVAAKFPRTPAPLVPANIGEGPRPSQPVTTNQGGRPRGFHNGAELSPLEVLVSPTAFSLVAMTKGRPPISVLAPL